jgi:hypothetical protein
MSKTYKSPKSKLIKTITITISIVLTIILIGLINQIYLESRSSMRLTFLTLTGIIVFCISYSIYKSLKKIVLYESYFEIHYVGYKQIIPFEELISVSSRKTLPPFFIGSQGFWGINGKINRDIETSVNSLDDMVLIITDKKKIIISVENPTLFVQEINTLI